MAKTSATAIPLLLGSAVGGHLVRQPTRAKRKRNCEKGNGCDTTSERRLLILLQQKSVGTGDEPEDKASRLSPTEQESDVVRDDIAMSIAAS